MYKLAGPQTISCNFDIDICGWSQVTKTDDFDWTVNSGPTSTTGTGPSKDHTSGSKLICDLPMYTWKLQTNLMLINF